MTIQEATAGNWLQLKGEIKRRWGKLTDDELTQIDGSKDKLIGKLVADYSLSKDEARKQVDQFWVQ